jgi:ParB family chromosome partitioning protein
MSKAKVFRIGADLSKGLEETATTAINFAGNLNLEAIPLSKIDLDLENPREMVLTLNDVFTEIYKGDPQYNLKMGELESLRPLASSIKRDGLINPIMVYRHGDIFRLVAGERRTFASIIAGEKFIQARIREKRPDGLELSLLQWAENIERKDLSLWERLRNIEKILTAYKVKTDRNQKITPTVLSELISCSLPHAMNYCTVLEADEELKVLIQTCKIKNLEKAALITKIGNVSLKAEAINACINGAPLSQLKIIANQDKKSAKLSENTSKMNSSRGRQAIRVNLGATTNINAVKFIVSCILSNEKYKKLFTKFTNIQVLNWDDYGSVNNAFKHILKTLEETE